MSEEEQDIVIEEPEQEEQEQKSAVAQEPEESELDSYSKGVQSRIKKLTEKYRQEERDKAEAVRVSTHLLEENKKLKSRVQALDTGYLNEYGTPALNLKRTLPNVCIKKHTRRATRIRCWKLSKHCQISL